MTESIVGQAGARGASDGGFRELAEALPVMVAASGPDGRLLWMNKAWVEYTGLSVDDLNEDRYPLIHPDDRARVIEANKQARRSGLPLEIDYRIRRHDGAYRWHLWRVVPVRDEHGDIVEWVGTTTDIEDRKRAELALRASEARANAVLQSAVDGILMLDADGCVHLMNPAAEELFGHAAEDVLGRNAGMLFGTRDGSVESEVIVTSSALQAMAAAPYVLGRRKDGSTFPLRLSVSALSSFDEEREVFTAVIHDLSERASVEQMLHTRVAQQASVARLGQVALSSRSLQPVFDAAARELAGHLGVELTEVLQLAADGQELILRAGVGWKEGLVGSARIAAGAHSLGGFTLASHGPVIVRDLRTETRFTAPHLLHDHSVVSGLTTLIRSGEREWGVLGACSTSTREFTADDLTYLESMANVLAQAIQRMETEDALRFAEGRAALATSAARMGAWEIHRDGRVAWSREQFELMGVAPQEGAPALQQWLDLLHPDDQDFVSDAFRRAVGGENEFQIETRFYRPNGELRWAGAWARIFSDANGEPVLMIGLSQDITERKRAEEALRRSEEAVREILDAMPAVVITAAPDGTFEYRSRQYYEYVGIEPGQEPDWAESGVLHPLDSERVNAIWSQAIETGEPFETEFRFRRHDGEYRRHQVRGVPLRMEDGSVRRWIGMISDVEDQRRAEDGLKASERQLAAQVEELQTLLRIAPVGIGIAYDPECRDIRVNAAFSRILRVPAGANASKTAPGGEALPFRVLRDGEEVPGAELPMQVAGRTGQPVRGEQLDVVFDDGTRVRLMENADPLFDEHGAVRGVLGTFVDITEIMQLQDELRAANAAKDEFLGLVSHELKTPITTIMGNAEILLRRGATLDDESRAEALTDIRNDGERLHRIIENLLVLARLERGKQFELEPLLLHRLAERLVDEHRRHHPARDVRVTYKDEPPAAFAEPGYAELVLRNLLSNAEKYSDADAPIEVSITAGDDRVVVEVADRGVGIPADETEEIFSPFYRSPDVASTVQGIGIGLAVCRRLIEVQGGRIWAQPREGGGSVFGFSLPRVGEEYAFARAAAG